MTAKVWAHGDGASDGVEHLHGWMVDVATRRVVRRRCMACEREAAEVSRLEREAMRAGATPMLEALEQIADTLESQRSG